MRFWHCLQRIFTDLPRTLSSAIEYRLLHLSQVTFTKKFRPFKAETDELSKRLPRPSLTWNGHGHKDPALQRHLRPHEGGRTQCRQKISETNSSASSATRNSTISRNLIRCARSVARISVTALRIARPKAGADVSR